jgi:hypothetical protein
MFSRNKYLPLFLGATFVVLGSGWLLLAEPQKEQPKVQADALKPQWHAGDQWTVETQTQQVQARVDQPEKPGDAEKKDLTPPVRWQFKVEKEEKIGEAKCLRVDVKCMIEGKQPLTTLWVDQKSMTIRRFQTQLHIQGAYRTITENYEYQDGQPSPVICPVTALPLDLPLFQKGDTKGEDTFYFEAISGPTGVKDPGDVGFMTEIKQKMSTVKPAEMKGLLADDFSKDLDVKPVVEVQLITHEKTVRQLWRPELPWPVYCDNGSTTARLVKYTPAKN